MRKLRLLVCGVVAAGLAACQEPLVVDNQNQADKDRTLATAADLETFIGSTYAVAHQGTLGGNDGLQTQLMVMAFENVSALANFGMGPRGAIPRTPIDNTPNAAGDPGNLRDFNFEHRAARMATLGLAKLKTVVIGNGPSDPRNARAAAFAHFTLGVALGNLSLAYDSGSIVTENDDFNATIPLSGYKDVNKAALAHLDSAIAIVRRTSAFPNLPDIWVKGNALTSDQFIRLIRSYKARFRAGVARTPTDRADVGAGGIVDWNQVILDAADSGLTSDLIIAMDPSAGWDMAWVAQHYATGSANWHQMSQFILGMADTSGGYDTWLSTTRFSRTPFLVVSPDRRLPQGATRAAQVGDTLRPGFRSFYVGTSANPGRPFVRNRPAGLDQPGDPFGISMYDFYRSRSFFSAARIGLYPVMTAAEIRLLAAEGYLRLGNFAAVMQRINLTRADSLRGNLPALAGLADTLTAVPGGTACVPRVPDAAQNFRKSKCGNIWDALKWEYRIETMYTGYGMWYFAGRGWGDIPEGTASNWPVPWQELFLRQEAIYGRGGLGQPGSAARGNYGLFDGGVYGW